MARRGSLVALWVLCAAAIVLVARGATGAEPPVVRIVVAGDATRAASVEGVVRELLGRLPVRLEWSSAPAIRPSDVLARAPVDPPLLARVWLDLTDASRARLYVLHPASDRFVVRSVPLRSGYDEVAREELGQVLASAVDAFLAGGEVGIPREAAEREVVRQAPPPPPPAPALPPPPPPTSASIRPSLAAVARPARTTLAVVEQATPVDPAPVVLQGPALLVAWAAPARAGALRFAPSMLVQYRAPARWDGAPVGVRLEGAAARAAVGVERDWGDRLRLRASVGGGLDWEQVAPYAHPNGAATPSPPFAAWSPVVGATVVAEVRIAGRWAIHLGAGADVDLGPTTYDVARAGRPVPAWTPWLVRPTASLGLAAQVD